MENKLIRKASVLVLTRVLALAGCSDKRTDPVAPAPLGGVFFAAQVQPVFNANSTSYHGEDGNGALIFVKAKPTGIWWR